VLFSAGGEPVHMAEAYPFACGGPSARSAEAHPVSTVHAAAHSRTAVVVARRAWRRMC